MQFCSSVTATSKQVDSYSCTEISALLISCNQLERRMTDRVMTTTTTIPIDALRNENIELFGSCRMCVAYMRIIGDAYCIARTGGCGTCVKD